MMRRVLVVLVSIVAVAFATTVAGCVDDGVGPGSPRPAPSASEPALITMPDVVGKNAAVAVDELERLGFTNIELGTVDGHAVVVLPQNWTVKAQSAVRGDRLPADAKIVLGCARIGDDPWPL